ncbi:MAG: YeeE/YedE family protein [Hyphomicrobiales bacterium]|nr:YeeE/YedE family protein [Hyphomicrobiales bacterium]MDE2114542.1 YeeE/YedE family protein [Hyphomicrobiales bacterium]
MQITAKPLIAALAAGTLFGSGLAVAGMTQPRIVQDFLDPFGHWNPALMFVMGCALLVAMVGFRLAFRRSKPFWAGQFHLPTARDLDAPLLIGSALFGIGWGLGGYCPGPAIASLPSLNTGVLVFVAAMMASTFATHYLRTRNRVKTPVANLEISPAE